MRTFFFLIVFTALPALAQQQVVPKDFDRGQERQFKRITESVSTPCCRNGIPVAYHDSGMAQYVRNVVIQSIRAGKSEKAIMADLAAMTLGPNKDHLIFTTPENNGLGWVIWMAPLTFVLIGTGVVFLVFNLQKAGHTKPDSTELLEKYRGYIRAQVAARD